MSLTEQNTVKALPEEGRQEQVYLASAKVAGIHANNAYPAELIYGNLVAKNNVIHEAFLSRCEGMRY